MFDDLSIDELTYDLRYADKELHRWQLRHDQVEEPGQKRIARSWVSYYRAQTLRLRNQLSAIRRARANQSLARSWS